MASSKKIKIYIMILSVAGLIFSIFNPSIDIAILVPFFWYIYVWEKKEKEEISFKYYNVTNILDRLINIKKDGLALSFVFKVLIV